MWSLFNNRNKRGASKKDGALFGFHGGLKLSTDKPVLANPVQTVDLPNTVYLPLVDYSGNEVEPVVSVNEQVSLGQHIALGVLAPCSGTVTAITEHAFAHPSGLSVPTIVIDRNGTKNTNTPGGCTEDNSTSCNSTGSDSTGKNCTGSREQTPCVLEDFYKDPLRFLTDAGISGLGGAGFPTASKLNTTKLQWLIINAAECEPDIACDEALMQQHSHDIVNGINALIKAFSPERCVFATEQSKPQALSAMEAAFEADAHGSESADTTTIETRVLPPRYPSGAENPLIETVTGVRIPYGKRPSTQGIVVVNVGTVYAVWKSICGVPLTSRLLTITGNTLANPCNAWVSFGTPIQHVLEQTGNASAITDCTVKVGGPLSGFELTDLNAPVTAKTNCLHVERSKPNSVATPCIRCGYCVDVCPARLLPQQLHWFAVAGDLARCEEHQLSQCIECGCCDVVCPSALPLTSTFRYAKSAYKHQQHKEKQIELSELRYNNREQRLQQKARAREQAIADRKAALKQQTQTHTSNTQNSVDETKPVDQAAIKDAIARARAKKKPRSS